MTKNKLISGKLYKIKRPCSFGVIDYKPPVYCMNENNIILYVRYDVVGAKHIFIYKNMMLAKYFHSNSHWTEQKLEIQIMEDLEIIL